MLRSAPRGGQSDLGQRAGQAGPQAAGTLIRLAQTGGFDAVDFVRRVDAAVGDATAAVHQCAGQNRAHPSGLTHFRRGTRWLRASRE